MVPGPYMIRVAVANSKRMGKPTLRRSSFGIGKDLDDNYYSHWHGEHRQYSNSEEILQILHAFIVEEHILSLVDVMKPHVGNIVVGNIRII